MHTYMHTHVQAENGGFLPLEAALCSSDEDKDISGIAVLNTTLQLSAEIARSCRGHTTLPIGTWPDISVYLFTHTHACIHLHGETCLRASPRAGNGQCKVNICFS